MLRLRSVLRNNAVASIRLSSRPSRVLLASHHHRFLCDSRELMIEKTIEKTVPKKIDQKVAVARIKASEKSKGAAKRRKRRVRRANKKC